MKPLSEIYASLQKKYNFSALPNTAQQEAMTQDIGYQAPDYSQWFQAPSPQQQAQSYDQEQVYAPEPEPEFRLPGDPLPMEDEQGPATTGRFWEDPNFRRSMTEGFTTGTEPSGATTGIASNTGGGGGWGASGLSREGMQRAEAERSELGWVNPPEGTFTHTLTHAAVPALGFLASLAPWGSLVRATDNPRQQAAMDEYGMRRFGLQDAVSFLPVKPPGMFGLAMSAIPRATGFLAKLLGMKVPGLTSPIEGYTPLEGSYDLGFSAPAPPEAFALSFAFPSIAPSLEIQQSFLDAYASLSDPYAQNMQISNPYSMAPALDQWGYVSTGEGDVAGNPGPGAQTGFGTGSGEASNSIGDTSE